jgi:hypothetical protein
VPKLKQKNPQHTEMITVMGAIFGSITLIPTTTFSRGSEHTLAQTVLPTRTSLTQTGASLSTVWQNALLEQLLGPSKEKMGGGVFQSVSQTD